MQVALLGGSFNPPHVGHLLAAHFVRATVPIDELWLVPSYRHPFGKVLAPFQHRLAMCQLLCNDASGWMRVSEVERDVGGEGWTVEMLGHLVRTYPEHRFTWIIGSDILPDLPRWRDFERIQQLANVLVLHRAGYPAPQALGPPLAEVSSSDIRRRFERQTSVEGLVPWRVAEYVRAEGLYVPEP